MSEDHFNIYDFGIFIFLNSFLQDLHSDLFRPTVNYKIIRTSLAYSKEKPFEDKNFNLRHQGPITCEIHNLMVNSNSDK